MYRVIGICHGLNNPQGGAQSAAKGWYENVQKSSIGTLQIDICKEPHSIFRQLFLLNQSPLGFVEWNYRSSRLIEKRFHNEDYNLAHIHCYGGFYTSPPDPSKTVVTLHDEPAAKYRDSVSPLYSQIIQHQLNYYSSIFKKKVLSKRPWIHALSNSVKSQLIEIGFDKSLVRVIPHGFLPSVKTNPGQSRKEVLQRIGLRESSRYVLVVGSIDYRKGGYRILEACKIIQQNDPDVHIVLAGKIDNFIQKTFARVMMQIKEKYDLTNFHLTGYLPYSLLNGLLWNCDTHLSASYSDTGPLSLMEAARFGVPIVATDVGIARDFFDGEATILAKDCSPYEIAEAISRTIDKPRKQYSCVSKFTKEKVTKQLLDFYLHILENSDQEDQNHSITS